MAIEFNCPYCTARIRVPDHAGGGKGRCPKCSTRISVPRVSAPPPAPEPAEAESSEADEPVQIIPSTADAPLFPSPIESQPSLAPPAVEFASVGEEPAAFDSGPSVPVEPANPLTGLPQFPVAPPSRLVHRKPVARKTNRKKGQGVWLIAAGVIVLLLGAVGVLIWQQSQEARFGGDLIAETADSLELPPGLIEKSWIRQPADDVTAVLTVLEKSPVPLLSSLMQVQLSGSAKGIQVSVNSAKQSRFYRVDVSDDAPLQKYRSKNAAKLEEKRLNDIEQASAAFVLDYQRVLARKAEQSSITSYRNSLALPGLVRGLGHQIVATHGSTVYPCVYEDHDGALYFLMPAGLREFELAGRKHEDGSVVFPGKYKATVAGEMKLSVKAAEDEAPDKGKDKKPSAKDSDVPEEKMDSKKSGTTKKDE